MHRVKILSAFTVLLSLIFWTSVPVQAAEIVIETYSAYPTTGSAQSKVWFARGSWWSWLPFGPSGGRIWLMGQDLVWAPEQHLDRTLRLLPGNADVWTDGDKAAGALQEGKRIVVQALGWVDKDSQYGMSSIPISIIENDTPGVITFDREGQAGAFWLCYSLISGKNSRVVVRRILPNFQWPVGEPVTLAQKLEPTDVCAMAALDSTVAVVWSEVKNKALVYRSRISGGDASQWTEPARIAEVEKTPYDGISLCRPADSKTIKLLAVTGATGHDADHPVLVLLVLNSEGVWHSVQFASREGSEKPVHPTVFWIFGRPVVAYTLVGAATQEASVNEIFIQQFSPDGQKVLGDPIQLISQTEGVDFVTAPKHIPTSTSSILFCSDHMGRVVEISLKAAKSAEQSN